MLCSAPTLRTAAIGCRIQPVLASPSPYSTSTPSQRRPQDSRSNQPTPRAISLSSLRHASTSTVSDTISTLPNSPSSTSSDLLDWNTFFQLRKSRRRWQLGSSVGTSGIATLGGIQLLTNQDVDALVGQIPLDPFITLGLMTFGCGALGWLMGPTVGSSIFNMSHAKYKSQIALVRSPTRLLLCAGKITDCLQKEKEFYERVRKYRVNPARQSFSNPVPDYYGEKIGSVKDYRQWLKDQRAFNKKSQSFV